MENYELILLDDCSDDGTLGIILNYEKQYPDVITVVHCEQKLPTGAVRNLGLSYASGEYLVFIDSDDCIVKNMLEVLYHVITKEKSDVVECDFQIFSENDPDLSRIPAPSYHSYSNITIEIRKQLLENLVNRSTVWGKMISKSFLKNTTSLFAKLEMVMMFFLPNFAHYKNYIFIDHPLYYYFANPQGIMWGTKHFAESVLETVRAQELLRFTLTSSLSTNSIYTQFLSEIEYIAICKIMIDSSSRYSAFYHSFHSSLLKECFIRLSTLYPAFADNKYFNNRWDHIEIIEQVLEENFLSHH